MGAQILGRDDELSLADVFLASHRSGPAALILEGEAGAGKTILLDEIGRRAALMGATILSCQPAEAETALSYAGLGDLLEPILPDALSELVEPRRDALEVALLRRPVTGRAPARLTVCRAALDVVHHRASKGWVLIAIDDVQWLDPSSTRAIEFIVRRLEGEPVTVLVAVRSDPAQPEQAVPPLALGRSLSDDQLATIDVGPLSLAGIHRLLQLRLDLSLSRHVASRVYDLSGGNPFWALEIGRALLREGPELDPRELPVPASMRELVSGRLRDLSPTSGNVVLIAGAMHQATAGNIATAIGVDAEDGLQEAIDAGILTRSGDRIRFTHPLLASVPYADASPARRREVHRRLADAISDPEERARHLALAAEGPEEAVALALSSAAELAAARAAMEAAAELSERAWRLTPTNLAPVREARALVAIDRLFAAGDMGRARAVADEALLETRGPTHAAHLFRIAVIRGRIEGPGAELALLTAARSEAGEDPASMAEIEREIAWVGVLSGEPTGFSIEHARSSLASAERADDRGLQAAALVSLAGFSFMHGDGLQLELFDRAAQLAGDDRPMFGLHLPLLERGVAVGILSKWADDFETARALLTERLGHYAGLGDESQIPFIQYHLSELECWQGNWARGRDLASEGIKLAGLGDQQTLVIVLALAIATIDALEGSTQAAMDAASDILTKSRDANFISALVQSRALLGFIGLSVDDPAAADAHLNGLTALMDSIEVREPGVIRFQADEIQAAISVGDLERADLLTDQLELRAASLDRPWGKVAGARSRALLLAERGGSEDALEAVDRALVHHERLAVPFELGRTLLVQGIVHRRLKHKRAAKDALDRALGIFERLGSPLWTSKARGELARIGLRPSAPLELTPTEARVAGLAAAGRTNREIASALYLSPKTVDSNLGRVYRKLGVRSRTELARQLPLDGEAIEREHTTPIDAID